MTAALRLGDAGARSGPRAGELGALAGAVSARGCPVEPARGGGTGTAAARGTAERAALGDSVDPSGEPGGQEDSSSGRRDVAGAASPWTLGQDPKVKGVGKSLGSLSPSTWLGRGRPGVQWNGLQCFRMRRVLESVNRVEQTLVVHPGLATGLPVPSGVTILVSGTPRASGPSCTIGACLWLSTQVNRRAAEGRATPASSPASATPVPTAPAVPTVLGHASSYLTVRIPLFAVFPSPFNSDLLTINRTAPHTSQSDRGESTGRALDGSGPGLPRGSPGGPRPRRPTLPSAVLRVSSRGAACAPLYGQARHILCRRPCRRGRPPTRHPATGVAWGSDHRFPDGRVCRVLCLRKSRRDQFEEKTGAGEESTFWAAWLLLGGCPPGSLPGRGTVPHLSRLQDGWAAPGTPSEPLSAARGGGIAPPPACPVATSTSERVLRPLWGPKTC
ncbi:uncharacterized protein LOC101682312 [Mustela putorius furo]|uniref:Uncharacterized protein LOC101682312 n=1 Tax=Mustela putorius furo TaxID=9669 RepID=A0A8U0RWE8_MUSPF|nr:uncharacterized protein LOC101682312 [Mustela putorius furo]